MKIVLCATHPWNTNGYSLVMSNLAQRLCDYDDVEKIYYFGFQNGSGDASRNKRQFPDKVELYDALANEQPRKQGFGDDLIKDYVAEKDPDVVVISNDSIVVERMTGKLMEIPERRFKIMVYQDLVYEHVRQRFVDQLNTRVDRVLAFTPYWKKHLEDQGVTTPVDVLKHAFDPRAKFPVNRALARRYFGIKDTDFIILNLNRNQPRKRWDICLKAYADFLSLHRGEAIKLLIGTSPQGSWDLLAIFQRELEKRGMTMEEGRKHLVVVDAPQRLSDEDVNILMNCADIGISASDGEGFGLCNFEHAALGCPQVVSNVGGHKEFFTAQHAFLCEPVMAYYVDRTRDGVGGEAQLIDYRDMVEGMELYYKDKATRKAHGDAGRRFILSNYKWEEQAAAFVESIRKTVADVKPAPVTTDNAVDSAVDVLVPDEIDLIPDVGQVADVIEPPIEATPQRDPTPEAATPIHEPEKIEVEDIQKAASQAVPAVPEPEKQNGELDLIREQLASLTAMVEKIALAKSG